MGLFSAAVTDKINQIAAKSNEKADQSSAVNTRSMNDELNMMSKQVMEYFSDSTAILITSKEELHEYVNKCIETGYAGIDTETTGLDRIHDHVVGASLYTPGMDECYIPMKHVVPIFDTLYKNQLSYEDVGQELARLVEGNVKLIFANADFDLAMIYKDLKVDLIPAFYYDVITAWRCLREDEKDNSLKGLYAKYVKKGMIDPKKFTDFFSPKLFPNCKPQVAALYAANDARITYELFIWQLPYVTKSNEKCKKNKLEKIANLVWNIEFPLVAVCAHLHRRGVYLDDSISSTLHERYTSSLHADEKQLAECVQALIDEKDIASNRNRPFRSGSDFNPNSNPHVKYLINNLIGSTAKTTSKEVLKEINKPATKAVLKVRGDVKLLSTYVDKLPKAIASDHRIHSSFKAIGAATGRMCIAASQKVFTLDGKVEIQNVKPGDRVWYYNFKESTAGFSEVLNVWKTGENKKCLKICYENTSLICTPEHPILLGGIRWVQAKDLNLGDDLLWIDVNEDYNSISLKTVAVDSIEELDKTYDVYDIEVKDYHNFFVQSICVHNSSEAPNMQNIPSHALDIRHMFRATPEQNEIVDLSNYIDIDSPEKVATVRLSKYSKVRTGDGLTALKDLTEGQRFWFGIENGPLPSTEVNTITIDGGYAILSFDTASVEGNYTTLEIKNPAFVVMNSDFSQQEPKLSAYISNDKTLVDAFMHDKDAYATLASIALGFPYEECLEFNPITGELQPEGKERRSVGKVLNLGVTYGMSVQSIAESLFSDRDDMSDEDKLKEGQRIQDALMKGFPDLARAISDAQRRAAQVGYTETILGRRRHHPNMQLPKFEFVPMDGYVNPDIDPLDPKSLENKEQIPKRLVDQLTKEFNSYKYYGKIVKRTKELAEQKIKVINNSYKIEEASRQVFNCVDKETEILTLSGWKRWNEVSVGDKILSYSVENERIEEDVVKDVHIYNEPVEVIDFNSPTFNSSSTSDHRWAVWYQNKAKFVTTEHIERNKWPDYPIIRVGDNDFEDYAISDIDLRMLGWALTDASVQGDSITLYQSTDRGKNLEVYNQMISVLDELGLEYSDRTYEKYPGSHQIYIKVCDYSRYIADIVQHDKRTLEFDFVSKLSQRQCTILMRAMLQGDGEGVDGFGEFIDKSNVAITCNSVEKCNVFQYLAFRAGFATCMYEVTPEEHNSNLSANIVYDSVSNDTPIQIRKSYYKVAVFRLKRAQIYPHHKSRRIAEDGVWCVSTNNLTWIARRRGLTYVTGNSIIQGSAADLTKMAMLKLEHDPEWQEIGGRFLLPIHDELMCEVPIENVKRGAEVLARCMCEAGDFFPFSLKCDVDVNFRWYGLPYEIIISKEKPKSLDWESLSESNIEWLQCMVTENEYILPIFPEEDGSKPSGVRARGVNGKITDELKKAVDSYMKRYSLTDDKSFLDHIEAKVIRGVLLQT